MNLAPFVIKGPTSISFSGGRSSALMLWATLQANGGLPDDALVFFANTGKEAEATLRFVRDCESHWGVPIHWVEFRDDEAGFDFVTFETASREGEPFEALIRKRKYLPNPVTRFCTTELKIRTMARALRVLRPDWTERDSFIGIRADEHRRVAKIRARGRSTECADGTMLMPLADAGVSAREVGEFWSRQPFTLELATLGSRTLEGNCDLCFLKPLGQKLSLIALKPESPVWWARQEAAVGATFRKDEPGYAALASFIDRQGDFFGHDEGIDCLCGD